MNLVIIPFTVEKQSIMAEISQQILYQGLLRQR